MNNNYICHYGVPKMRWGFHLARIKNALKRQPKQKKEVAEVPKRKSAKDMSDEELKAAVARLGLEESYNKLNPEKVSAGRKFASEFINKAVVPAVQEASKQAIKSLLLKEVTKQVDNAAKKAAEKVVIETLIKK